MDWTAAIERNREALKRVLARLRVMAHIDAADEFASPLPRHLHRAVLRLLRPAEAAARRLVIVAARKIETPPPPPRFAWSPSPAAQGRIKGRGRPQRMILPRSRRVLRTGETSGSPRQGTAMGGGRGGAQPRPRKPCLPLFDRLPSWNQRRRVVHISVPRICFPGITRLSPIPPRPAPFDPIDATPLAHRLAALADALDDLPRHALRYARWQARRDAMRNARHQPSRPRRIWPLRPGRPPGRQSPRGGTEPHEVQEILTTVDGLALWALEPPDTS